VAFFNNLVNSNGRLFKCLQRAVIINRASDPEAACEQAKRAFEALEAVANWRQHAQFFEVEPLSARPRSGARAPRGELGTLDRMAARPKRRPCESGLRAGANTTH
jgi:hypothetical protein